jgi:hypothetical protein
MDSVLREANILRTLCAVPTCNLRVSLKDARIGLVPSSMLRQPVRAASVTFSESEESV